MKLSTFASLIAVATTLAAGPALAWDSHATKWTYNPYGHDTRCDDHNCYTPGTAYEHGHYSYIRCADPYKYFTHRNGIYTCVPHAHVEH